MPSKDLRIFDPELKHVVLVDDNPARVFQPLHLKAQPKFDADAYYEATQGKKTDLIAHYESALLTASSEIAETVEAAKSLKISFSQAFLPYSYAGERVFRNFSRSSSRKNALAATRRNPSLQEAGFVPANP